MRKPWMLVCAALAMLCMVSCSKRMKAKLFIYNWTYYIPDKVIAEFERRYDIKVVYDMYASNEEMFAKLKAGGGGYDLVFPSGDYVSIMIREGMVEEIDKSRISNFSLIDTSILEKIHFDPGCRYCVPFMTGAAGVTVNREKISDFERSWNLFDRTDLKGRLTMLDDMREVMGAALRTLGYSVNSTDREQLIQAKAVVMRWRENIVKFDAEAFGKGFAAGEFWGVHGYAENVFLELDSLQTQNAEYFIPREGGCAYIDNMVLLKGTKNRDAAYTFMNYIHEPAVYAKIADFLQLPSINTGAVRLRTTRPHYELKDLVNSEFKEDLGEHLELYNAIWQEIRIGK